MSGNKIQTIKSLLKYLPEKLTESISNLNDDLIVDLCEIRIRAMKPIILVFTENTYFLTYSGRITSFYSVDCISLSDAEVETIFTRMCNYSVYSHTENISKGFITIDCGMRVGVYGTAVTVDGKINAVRNVRGLNIRIPSAHNGVSQSISEIFKNGRRNVLICGPPLSGKTTVLKDLCRTLSDKFNYKLSVIDERGEFEKEYVGINTDVLSFYPKDTAIEISVRTLSPDIIVCDELGDSDEVKSVLDGLNCGVNFIMTLHSNNLHELVNKNQFKILINRSVIDYIVFLKNKSEIDIILNHEELINEIDSFTCDFNCADNDRISCVIKA